MALEAPVIVRRSLSEVPKGPFFLGFLDDWNGYGVIWSSVCRKPTARQWRRDCRRLPDDSSGTDRELHDEAQATTGLGSDVVQLSGQTLLGE